LQRVQQEYTKCQKFFNTEIEKMAQKVKEVKRSNNTQQIILEYLSEYKKAELLKKEAQLKYQAI